MKCSRETFQVSNSSIVLNDSNEESAAPSIHGSVVYVDTTVTAVTEACAEILELA